MNQIPKKFKKDYVVAKNSYVAFKLFDVSNYEINGNNKFLDGKNICCHLLHIHNSNVVIRNLTFKNGNTKIVRNLETNQIPFSKPKGSIFQIIDGGAVLITGNSTVDFEDCKFINNTAIMCGGAISNQSIGKVTVRNCIFESNKAGHTGAAIDNLVRSCNLLVEKCSFVNNQSNIWNKFDYPHGQITVFPETKAEIRNSSFEGGSIPFDFKNTRDLKISNNIYGSYANWNENLELKRIRPLNHIFTMIQQLYWLPFKTGFNAYYRVNR